MKTTTTKKTGSPAVDRRMEEIVKTFGTQVREARQKAGVSITQLADMLAMKQPLISDIENGKRNLTLYSILELAEKLNIEIRIDFLPA